MLGRTFYTHAAAGASIQGNPGDTIGWGYSITNTSADFLLPMNLDAGPFPTGMTPLNIFDFPVVAPNSTVTLDFSAIVTGTCASPPCGIYQVTWIPWVAPGTTVNGFFDVFVRAVFRRPLQWRNRPEYRRRPHGVLLGHCRQSVRRAGA